MAEQQAQQEPQALVQVAQPRHRPLCNRAEIKRIVKGTVATRISASYTSELESRVRDFIITSVQHLEDQQRKTLKKIHVDQAIRQHQELAQAAGQAQHAVQNNAVNFE